VTVAGDGRKVGAGRRSAGLTLDCPKTHLKGGVSPVPLHRRGRAQSQFLEEGLR
jgi:hypothetical protein